MPFGTEVGLGPDYIVLDGDPALPKMGHSTPTFRPMSVVAKQLVGWLEFSVPFQHKYGYIRDEPNGWMNQDATW